MITNNNPLFVEWLKDDINRMNLAALLKEPTMVEAMKIIRRNYQPSATTATIKDPTVGSSTYHIMSGANEALDDLAQLASEPKKNSSEPPPKEWAHLANQP